jgi:hypothetical protein
MLWRMPTGLRGLMSWSARCADVRAAGSVAAGSVVATALAVLLMLSPAAAAQKAYPLPPGSATAPSAPASSDSASPAPVAPAQAQGAANPGDEASAPVLTPASTQAPAPPGVPLAKSRQKPKKDAYTGPTEIVTLPATPMLDVNGKPELDPDGKPLLTSPRKQLRDRKGHPVFDETVSPSLKRSPTRDTTSTGSRLRRRRRSLQSWFLCMSIAERSLWMVWSARRR